MAKPKPAPKPAKPTKPAERAPLSERTVLVRCGITEIDIARAERQVGPTSTSLAERLILAGRLDEAHWYQALAAALGLDWVATGAIPTLAAERDAWLPPPQDFARARQIWLEAGATRLIIVAPTGDGIAALARDLARNPDWRRRVLVAAPRAIQAALRQRYAGVLTGRAIQALATETPNLSAKRLLAPDQRRLAYGLLVATTLVVTMLSGVAGLAIAGLFALAGLVKFAAALQWPGVAQPAPLRDDALPSYCVLAPLHREAESVAALAAALAGLDYPIDRLDIKLVVEADDAPTCDAALAAADRYGFDVVMVPPSLPRTKPKALDYALALTDADLVTIFDAEDRPDPRQLRIAAAAFAAGPPDLVCVQATLLIDHARGSHSWISRQFALEYAMLFEGILPFVARRGLLFPLGGTSNHFRRDALVEAGAWDPHNVTEDADIAVRLVRAGGRLGLIPSWTAEEAPLAIRPWLAQRSRWLKGFLQTWLVHMRSPNLLLAEIGFKNFLCFQALVAGVLATAVAYPVSLGLIAANLVGWAPLFEGRGLVGQVVVVCQILALLIGWGGAIALALRAQRETRAARPRDLALTLVYWLLPSLALVRALRELLVAPHRWNKTSHGHATRTPLAKRAKPRL